ncbi:hypothetical protein LWI28_011721 [Acer negundo]|uniref:Uncharacterized protein n=1 Tax=Acer negundo TaxID=4023 RepID=A0AAD5IA45_ACENE|nr:hypothetical protein LWI28_011721 [Acer negundo]
MMNAFRRQIIGGGGDETTSTEKAFDPKTNILNEQPDHNASDLPIPNGNPPIDEAFAGSEICMGNDNQIIKTRCTPSRLRRIVDRLSEEKKEAVRGLGFGNLLLLRCGRLRLKICGWLLFYFHSIQWEPPIVDIASIPVVRWTNRNIKKCLLRLHTAGGVGSNQVVVRVPLPQAAHAANSEFDSPRLVSKAAHGTSVGFNSQPDIKNALSINKKRKHDMDCQKKELEQQAKKLEECKAQKALERRFLMNEIKKALIFFYVQMESPNYEEALKKARGLVTRLEEEIGDKNQQLSDTKASMLERIARLTEKVTARDRRLFELEQIFRESFAAATVRQLMVEKTKLHEEYTKEIRNAQYINIKQKHDMNCQKIELEQRAEEREDFKAWNALENRGLMDDIETLKGKLQNQNPSGSDSNLNDQIAILRDQLEEKTEALQYLESLNNTLTLKESMSNQELQDARKESISVIYFLQVIIYMIQQKMKLSYHLSLIVTVQAGFAR